MTGRAPRHLLRRITVALLLVASATVTAKLAVCRWAFAFSAEALATQLAFSAAFFFPFVLGVALYARWRLRGLLELCRAIHDNKKSGYFESPRVRRRALTFPLHFALLGLGLMLCGVVAKAFFDSLVLELPWEVALGLALTISALGLAMATLFYMVARRWMHPVIAAFGYSEVPPGPRISLVPKITFTLLAAAIATVVPPAVIHLARVESEGRAATRRNQEQLVAMVARGSRWMSPRELRENMTSPRLRAARLRLSEKPALISAPLAAHHGRLFVAAAKRRDRHGAPLLLSLLGTIFLLLGALIGRNLGRAMVDDVRRVTISVQQLLRTGPDALRPIRARAPQLREPDALVNTLNALLLRSAELNVAHFVAIERIIEADRTKTQFLANMSHDLRSPLNSTLGFSELLLRGIEGDLTKGQRASLETIRRNARQLLHLINEVLDFAKLDAGKLSPHAEEVLVTPLFTAALKQARERGYLGAIEVETEIQPGLPPLWADGERLGEALIYLLRFTVRASSKGPVRVNCRLRAPDQANTQRRLEITIADESEGIPAELLGSIFDGFHRYPGHAGLGLGLPLARAFIEMHGGHLDVTSSEEGNRFVATLPALERRAGRKRTPTP